MGSRQKCSALEYYSNAEQLVQISCDYCADRDYNCHQYSYQGTYDHSTLKSYGNASLWVSPTRKWRTRIWKWRMRFSSQLQYQRKSRTFLADISGCGVRANARHEKQWRREGRAGRDVKIKHGMRVDLYMFVLVIERTYAAVKGLTILTQEHSNLSIFLKKWSKKWSGPPLDRSIRQVEPHKLAEISGFAREIPGIRKTLSTSHAPSLIPMNERYGLGRAKARIWRPNWEGLNIAARISEARGGLVYERSEWDEKGALLDLSSILTPRHRDLSFLPPAHYWDLMKFEMGLLPPIRCGLCPHSGEYEKKRGAKML